jgi:beta-lysine 5,6-aminomutase alpha subunit
MLTEAVHTPLLQDRYASIKAAAYARKAARHLRQDLKLEKGGKVERRAREILEKALSLLQSIEDKGMFRALEEGVFAGIRRTRDGGKGLEGVFSKGPAYYNPVEEALKRELGISS